MQREPNCLTPSTSSPAFKTDTAQSQDTAASSSKPKTIAPNKNSDLQSATIAKASTAPKTPLVKNTTVNSVQLKNALRATLEKVAAAKEDVAPTVAAPGTSTSSNSQSDQLAAYRQRHIQNRPAVTPSTSKQPSENSANGNNRRPVTNPSTSKNVTRNIHDYISVVNPRGQMAAKLVAAAPYNFFLTTITSSKPTHSEPLSITFQGKLSACNDITNIIKIYVHP